MSPSLRPLSAAQTTALRRLVADGTLTSEQCGHVEQALATAQAGPGPRRWIVEVAGYLGGALMFGGATVLLATTWDRLTDTTRAALLVAVTILLALAGLLVAGGPTSLVRLKDETSSPRRRVVGLLFAIAALTASAATGVAVDHHAAPIAAAVGLAVAVIGYALVPQAIGTLAVSGFTITLTTTIVGDVGYTGLRMSAVMLATGVVLAALGVTGLLAPRQLALAIGAGIAVIGGQQPLAESGTAVWAYLLTALVGVACFALYRSQHALVLLVIGVIAVAIAVPEAVWDLTDGAAGGAVILIVAGATLIAASAAGLRIWRSDSAPEREEQS